MPVDLTPPAASDPSLTPIASTVDPAFEERWSVQSSTRSAVLRRRRFIAIAVVIAAVPVFSGWTLLGGFL
jgi:hypothetical protein